MSTTNSNYTSIEKYLQTLTNTRISFIIDDFKQCFNKFKVRDNKHMFLCNELRSRDSVSILHLFKPTDSFLTEFKGDYYDGDYAWWDLVLAIKDGRFNDVIKLKMGLLEHIIKYLTNYNHTSNQETSSIKEPLTTSQLRFQNITNHIHNLTEYEIALILKDLSEVRVHIMENLNNYNYICNRIRSDEAKELFKLFRPDGDFLVQYQGEYYSSKDMNPWWNIIKANRDDKRQELNQLKVNFLSYIIDYIKPKRT